MSRVTPATLMLGVFAVLFGLVGAYAVRRYLSQPEAVPPPVETPAPRQITVPVASTDIDGGRPLHMYDIAITRMPQEELNQRVKDGRLPPQMMTNSEQIIGRILKEPLQKGDAFQTDMFYPQGSGPSIAEKIEPGLRAVNIAVEGTGVLSGYDGPGSMVDVLFKADAIESGSVPETTVTLLEGVEVLAIDDNPGGRANTVQKRTTLAVTAEQANALKIAEGRGTFSLSLRNPDDLQIAGVTQPQTLERLLNLPVQEEFTTEIFRGGNRNASVFAGRTYVPQPVTTLPLSGLLQRRSSQQPASVNRPQRRGQAEDQEEEAEREPPAKNRSEEQEQKPPAADLLPPAPVSLEQPDDRASWGINRQQFSLARPRKRLSEARIGTGPSGKKNATTLVPRLARNQSKVPPIAIYSQTARGLSEGRRSGEVVPQPVPSETKRYETGRRALSRRSNRLSQVGLRRQMVAGRSPTRPEQRNRIPTSPRFSGNNVAASNRHNNEIYVLSARGG